jgi:hypothetical protein
MAAVVMAGGNIRRKWQWRISENGESGSVKERKRKAKTIMAYNNENNNNNVSASKWHVM